MDVPRAKEHIDKAEALVTDQAELRRLYFRKGIACLRSMETTNGFELTRRSMELSEQLGLGDIGNQGWWIHAAMLNTRFLFALGRFAEAHALELKAREMVERFEDPLNGGSPDVRVG